MAQRVKRLPAMQETRVQSPGPGSSPGEGNGNPLQYSCLENPMDGKSLVGYSPWGRKESDTTERAHFTSLLRKVGSRVLNICYEHVSYAYSDSVDP